MGSKIKAVKLIETIWESVSGSSCRPNVFAHAWFLPSHCKGKTIKSIGYLWPRGWFKLVLKCLLCKWGTMNLNHVTTHICQALLCETSCSTIEFHPVPNQVWELWTEHETFDEQHQQMSELQPWLWMANTLLQPRRGRRQCKGNMWVSLLLP